MGTDVIAALVVLLYVWLAVLQLFDAWITHQGLSRCGRELNPLMRWAIQKAGVLPGLLIPMALGMGAMLYAQPPVWLMGALVALYMAVCGYNLSQMERR